MTYLNESVSGFEGPEKKICVHFYSAYTNTETGLLSLPKTFWEEVVQCAKAEIVSEVKSPECSAFVLTESSLFVYSNKVLIKTCGTTTLLDCLDHLFSGASKIDMYPARIVYSRRHFNFPSAQPPIHSSFVSEVNYLETVSLPIPPSISPANVVTNSNSSEMGPSGREWFFFSKAIIHDGTTPPTIEPHVEVMMDKLDEDTMKLFFTPSPSVAKRDSLINSISLGLTLDTKEFDPCGYSLNGIAKTGRSYCTAHITPEPEFSFVSFEYSHENLNFVKDVIDAFKPAQFSVAYVGFTPEALELENFVSQNSSCPITDLAVSFSSFNLKSLKRQIDRPVSPCCCISPAPCTCNDALVKQC